MYICIDILRNLWDPTVFYSLLHCAHKTANTALALDLLSDMKTLHLNQSKSVRAIDWVRVFEKLLSLVRTRSDLAHYLPVSAYLHVAIMHYTIVHCLYCGVDYLSECD